MAIDGCCPAFAKDGDAVFAELPPLLRLGEEEAPVDGENEGDVPAVLVPGATGAAEEDPPTTGAGAVVEAAAGGDLGRLHQEPLDPAGAVLEVVDGEAEEGLGRGHQEEPLDLPGTAPEEDDADEGRFPQGIFGRPELGLDELGFFDLKPQPPLLGLAPLEPPPPKPNLNFGAPAAKCKRIANSKAVAKRKTSMVCVL